MVVFYIIRNLFRLAMRIILLPLALFTGRYLQLILLAALAFWLFKCQMEPTPLPPNAGQKPLANGNIPGIIIDPVRKEEDGNSVFATDLIAKMNQQERTSYSQHFYWALNKGTNGQTYRWNVNNIAGEITLAARFKNKSGGQCIRFREVLKVHEIRQNLRGLACARGDGSWCKLREGSTPACGLGKERGMFDGLTRQLNDLF